MSFHEFPLLYLESTVDWGLCSAEISAKNSFNKELLLKQKRSFTLVYSLESIKQISMFKGQCTNSFFNEKW